MYWPAWLAKLVQMLSCISRKQNYLFLITEETIGKL